jgi:hypothetical protein
MKDEIAKLEVIGIQKNGSRIKITAKIGKPYPVAENEDLAEWACHVALEPLYTRLHDIHGGGSFQALCLASNLLLSLLEGFIEKGGQLVHDDGTTFPIEAYCFGITKDT